MLKHGGCLGDAAKEYNIPIGQWLDLSTGINPHAWPVPPLPENIWQRLPEENDGLVASAQSYYKSASILPVAGSQAAIQSLPRLRMRAHGTTQVGIASPAYAEHQQAWASTGHNVHNLHHQQIDTHIETIDTLILINPNNPNGHRYPPQQIKKWLHHLSQRGGWLIVDEAFIDTCQEESLCEHTPPDGLIILRSLGKFFGLAGARVGFICAHKSILQPLQELLGPWPISTPARWLSIKALNDHHWQNNMRAQLRSDSQRLHSLLTQYDLSPDAGCDLFQWITHTAAVQIQHSLAQEAILVRCFNDPHTAHGLRFGLPANDHQWQHLETALSTLRVLQ